jgi:hypothetical protein
VQSATDGSGKITITDAAGNASSLYFTDDESMLSRAFLPPVPPAGAFDVRFIEDTYAARFAEGKKLLALRSVLCPFRLRADGVDVIVQDNINGKIFFAAVRSGEEIIINNPELTTLAVSAMRSSLTYRLNQNYPNPFNPATTIRFAIPNDQFVTLKVYNLLGEQVAVLHEELMKAGAYETEFNSNNLSSGIYLYELRAGAFHQTMKMQLLK